MGVLKDWDFGNEENNCKSSLINRQKSAIRLEVVSIDLESSTGIFFDSRNGSITASLTSCECNDFSFVGATPRKKFTPCMHIYRLAKELGLMEITYLDAKTRRDMLTPNERKKLEVQKIREFPREPEQWGEWNKSVHTQRSQKERQHRAFEIFLKTDFQIHDDRPNRVSGYPATLQWCNCADFEERRLPCKHIYCLALAKGHELPVTLEMYKTEKENFENHFVPLISISIGT